MEQVYWRVYCRILEAESLCPVYGGRWREAGKHIPTWIKNGYLDTFDSQQLKTCSQVLTIAWEVKRGLEKKNHSQMKNQAMKRPFQQMGRGGPVRATRAPMTKQPFQPVPLQMIRPIRICGYCQKADHTQQNCRRANGLCLACGSSGHTVEGCPHERTGTMTRALPVVPAPTTQRNSGPIIGKGSSPSKATVFSSSQEGDQS